MNRYLLAILISIYCAAFILSWQAVADPGSIFAEIRADGTVVYTDKPKDPKASVKLDLTPLARYTPSPTDHSSLHKQTHVEGLQKEPATCFAHGGTDCAAGADQDGSVICTDGFRGVKARFNFNCRQVKLAVNNAEYDPTLRQLKVLVRNASQIPALNVVVSIKQKGQSKVVSNVVDNIDPFGAGDFLFNNLILLDDFRAKLVDNLVVSCDNCG